MFPTGGLASSSMTRGIPTEVLDRLAAVPLFSECSRTDLRAIATLGTQLELRAGRVLTTEGEPGSEFFLVRSGAAACVRKGRKVASFGPGDFFGETALLTNAARSATVTATGDMTVIVFSRPEFSSLLDRSPQIARKLLKALAERREVS